MRTSPAAPDFDEAAAYDYGSLADPSYDESAQLDYDTDFADPDAQEASQGYYKRS